MNERELLQLKKDIDSSKQQVSELKGERQALLKMLNEEWGCKSIKEAQIKLQELSDKCEKLSEEIDDGVKELEQKLEYGTYRKSN